MTGKYPYIITQFFLFNFVQRILVNNYCMIDYYLDARTRNLKSQPVLFNQI